MALWDSLLQRRRRIVGLGSSDWHRTDHPIGTASVRVWAAELSEARDPGRDAGRRRVVVMADAATPPPELIVRAGESGARRRIPSRRAEPPLRAEVKVPFALPGGRVDLVHDGGDRLAALITAERARSFRADDHEATLPARPRPRRATELPSR